MSDDDLEGLREDLKVWNTDCKGIVIYFGVGKSI